MNTDYYDKLLTFLNNDIEKLSEDIVLKKGEDLEVQLPQSLVRFYYYFGKCEEVLNGYYKFFKLDEIKVLNEGIVFGINDEGGTLGIRFKDLEKSNDPEVFYTRDDGSDWFSELNRRSSEAFFFNVSCMNILYHKPFISAANISNSVFKKQIFNKKFIFSFSDNDNISNGYQRIGCLDKSGKILCCYFDLIGKLFIASNSSEDLEEFINSTDINFKPFSFEPVKKPKKKKPLSKIDSGIMTECYEKLLTFLNNDVEKLSEDIVLKKQKELGIKLPQQLVNFYRYFGSCDEILDSFYELKKLDNIHIENNVLIFGSTDEAQTVLGISLDNIEDDKTYVTEFSDEKCTDIIDCFGASTFFFNVACFQMMNAVKSMAVVYMSKKYFFSKILDKKNMYSFYDDKQLKKGFKMSACHSEDFSVIGCYIDDRLYVAANDDEVLNEFEKKTRWNLDWL